MYLFGKKARQLSTLEFGYCLDKAIRRKDKNAIHALYFHFVPSIVSLCSRLQDNPLDYEGRVSCAIEGVGIAIRRLKYVYDSPKQAAEYIHKTAMGHLMRAIRRENWRQVYIPCSVDAPIQKGGEETFRDIIPDKDEAIEDILIREDTLKVFKERLKYVLTGRERQIVELLWGFNDEKPMTFKGIGKTLKPPSTGSAVEQMYKTALRRLRRDPIIREIAK